MPTAFRDMQPWRRSLVVNGLTYGWLAQRTGVSPSTVESYALGRRTPRPEWIAKAEAAITEHERTAA